MVRRTGSLRTLIALLAFLLWAPVSAAAANTTAPAQRPAADACRVLGPGASAGAHRPFAAACAELA
ncbi:hypothetical protein ACFVIN_23385, partial [Streptomyces prasinus]